jgi:hypothetical protein
MEQNASLRTILLRIAFDGAPILRARLSLKNRDNLIDSGLGYRS